TTKSVISLNGTSPSTVYDVRVVNQEHAISEWTSADDWNLDNILLREGENIIVVQGVNHEGVIVHTEEFKIVKNQDSPPVISIQSTPASRNLRTTESIEFDLGESFDPEGTELSFAWSVSPEHGVTLTVGDSKAVMSFAIPGQYSVNVRATDGDGSESVAVREVTVYGSQGFSSFKSNYLDDFWETKNIDIEDNTPERSSYSLETLDGQLHIKIINDRDYPLGLPDVSLPPSKNYVSLGDTWKYNDNNLDFGVNFSRIDFDDSSWLSAPGIFGNDSRAFPDPGLQTPLNRDSANNLLTYYFRKKFDFKDDPIGSQITLEAILDDGARFWINGQEIKRVRLPASPAEVNWKSRASGSVPSRDEGTLLPVITIDGSGILVEGTNVLAVDLHNYSAGSSDIAMGATLDIAAQPSGAGGGGIESTIHPWIKRDIPDDEDWLLQTDLELYGLQFGDFVTGLMVEVERDDKRFRYGFGNKGGDQLSVIQVTPAATTGALFSLPYTLTNDMTVRIKRQANDLVFEWRPNDQFEEVYRLNLPEGTKVIDGGPFAATQTPLELNVLFDYVLLSLPDSASSIFDQLVVSEIMYKPEGGAQYEFIELFNAGTSTINLKDFRFPQGQPFDEFVFGDVEMQAGSYLLVVNDIESFKSRYGEGLNSIIAGEWGGGSLSNGGEVITLLDDRGLTVLSFEYDDSEPWPTSPDENGTSLTLSDPQSGGIANAENWSSSNTTGGSPGATETVTAFSDWLKERGETNPLAIKEGEVLNNLFTYAFGLDVSNARPEDAVPSPELVSLEGEDYLTIKYHKRISDPEITYEVELSNDGTNWSSEGLNLIVLPSKMVADGVEVVAFRMENPLELLDHTFLRLVVSFK
ncbi:MAG: lamin tail domain-containing protein, partial [Verrucomicrobiales bacterium]|nr:lamin tail domain-containing protein [Verrucomicrobiales bacterium]